MIPMLARLRVRTSATPWCMYSRSYSQKAADKLVFRNARPDDKSVVLGLRHNVYRGLDYLPDYFDFFNQDPNRRCVVGEIDNQVVVFGVMLTLDGGRAIVGQAGRVHEQHEGRGYFRAMNAHVNRIARDNGCMSRVAMVETTLNKYARSEKFKKTHTEILSKLHYLGVINEALRGSIQRHVDASEGTLNVISDVTVEQLVAIFTSTISVDYLFPGKKLFLDYIPYHCLDENVTLLSSRNTRFFSTYHGPGGGDHFTGSGLLTAGSHYKCSTPPNSYTLDIFGSDYRDLEAHVLFHLGRALERTSGAFCFQIFVEKGYIAQELCNILIKLHVAKCTWYAEGGVTMKTIVEERFT